MRRVGETIYNLEQRTLGIGLMLWVVNSKVLGGRVSQDQKTENSLPANELMNCGSCGKEQAVRIDGKNRTCVRCGSGNLTSLHAKSHSMSTVVYSGAD